MTAESNGFLQVMKDAPLGLRVALAGVWVGALLGGIASIWGGDWLSVGFLLAMIWQQTWLVGAIQRGSSPSGREKVALGALTILILLLSIVILMRRFVS